MYGSRRTSGHGVHPVQWTRSLPSSTCWYTNKVPESLEEEGRKGLGEMRMQFLTESDFVYAPSPWSMENEQRRCISKCRRSIGKFAQGIRTETVDLSYMYD
jgi:hypothetical protein